MRSWKVALVLAVISLLLAFALAAAQEPVRDFTQLNTRLKPGDKVWVTDAQGREVKGKIVSLQSDALALDSDGAVTFPAGSIRAVREREADSIWNGAIIGGSAGALLGTGLGDFSGSWDWGDAAVGAVMIGGIGAAIGIGIDALIPGKKVVVYRAPAPGGSPSARLSVAPFVTPRAEGVAIAYAF